MRVEYELTRLNREKKWLQDLINCNAPQSEIDNQKSIISYWQGQYDYKKNKLFDCLSDEEEKAVISHFNNEMDIVVNQCKFMAYNSPQNDFQHIYELLKDTAMTCMIPNNLQNEKELYDYNVAFDCMQVLLTRYIMLRFNNIKN